MRPLAQPHHGAWERCSAKVRDLHARNVAVLLGTDLRQPAHAVVCWTRDGQDHGGTGLAIRLAQHHRIPVLNLAEMDVRAAMDRLERIAQSLEGRNEKQYAVPGRRPARVGRSSAEGDPAALHASLKRPLGRDFEAGGRGSPLSATGQPPPCLSGRGKSSTFNNN